MVASGMAPGSGLHHRGHAGEDGAEPVRRRRRERARRQDEIRELSRSARCQTGRAARPEPALGDATAATRVYATNHGGRESVEVFELDTSGAAPHGDLGRLRRDAGQHGAQQRRRIHGRLARRDGADSSRQDVRGCVCAAQHRRRARMEAGRQDVPGACPAPSSSANNGIETSPDDREFYVASTTTKRVIAFARNEAGHKPLRTAQLKEFGPDNVRWTADNRLITAGMIDNEPACGGAPKDRGRHQVPTRLRRRDDRSEDDGGDRDRARTGDAVVHRHGDRDARWRRVVARLVLRRSTGVSQAEAVALTIHYERAGKSTRAPAIERTSATRIRIAAKRSREIRHTSRNA